jgi:hypothetical protein
LRILILIMKLLIMQFSPRSRHSRCSQTPPVTRLLYKTNFIEVSHRSPLTVHEAYSDVSAVCWTESTFIQHSSTRPQADVSELDSRYHWILQLTSRHVPSLGWDVSEVWGQETQQPASHLSFFCMHPADVTVGVESFRDNDEFM